LDTAATPAGNAMIDRHPGLILRCTCTADVVAAVNVARAYGLHPAVPSGPVTVFLVKSPGAAC